MAAPSWRMPAVFIGHGTPFNAVQDNRFNGLDLGCVSMTSYELTAG